MAFRALRRSWTGDRSDSFKRTPLVRMAVVVLAAITAASLPAAVAIASSGSISGTAFKDLNRDGVQQAEEPPLAGQLIYLFDGSGAYVANATSDVSGRFMFDDLGIGQYRVEYATTSWRELRDDWVTTTTGSIRPTATVTLVGHATVDFGWREIIRSRDIAAPISTFVGPNGLKVHSYNDVVSALEIYLALMSGTVGAEAPFVTVRFDYSDTSRTTAAYQGSPGAYSNYRATSYNNWISWVTKGDSGLAHEYGHAWSLYHDVIVQQDGQLSGYLRARGLEGEERINSSYTWSARELVAEDYRQLLGSPNAQQASHLNSEIPPASEVPGLKEFLLDTFTVAPATPTQDLTPTQAPTPTAAQTTSPTQTPTPTVLPTPVPTLSPSPTATPAPSPTASPTESPAPSLTPPPSSEPTLEITTPSVNPTPVLNFATVTSELNAPAAVTVEIRTTRGQVVRTLMSNVQMGAGTVQVVWDRKDARGKRVKSGAYLAVVVAVSADATSVRSEQVFEAS